MCVLAIISIQVKKSFVSIHLHRQVILAMLNTSLYAFDNRHYFVWTCFFIDIFANTLRCYVFFSFIMSAFICYGWISRSIENDEEIYTNSHQFYPPSCYLNPKTIVKTIGFSVDTFFLKIVHSISGSQYNREYFVCLFGTDNIESTPTLISNIRRIFAFVFSCFGVLLLQCSSAIARICHPTFCLISSILFSILRIRLDAIIAIFMHSTHTYYTVVVC